MGSPGREDDTLVAQKRRSQNERGSHAGAHARHPGVRRRQPPLRDRGRAHEVPAGAVQGGRRLRRGAGPHEDRRQGPHQRLHPEPDLRGGGPSGRDGGVLPARQPRGEEPPRDLRRADAGDPRVPRAERPRRADGRAGHRPRAHVPHARQPRRGAHAGRPRAHPRGHPRAQRVDARDLDLRLRGPHLHHPGDHPADRRQGDRGARVGGRARRPRRADPARAGAGLPRLALVRPAGVRPVLGEGRRARHPRRDALVRQRLRALRQRLDGQRQRDAAVQAPGVPHAPGVAADRGRGVGAWSATAPSPASRSSRWR